MLQYNISAYQKAIYINHQSLKPHIQQNNTNPTPPPTPSIPSHQHHSPKTTNHSHLINPSQIPKTSVYAGTTCTIPHLAQPLFQQSHLAHVTSFHSLHANKHRRRSRRKRELTDRICEIMCISSEGVGVGLSA